MAQDIAALIKRLDENYKLNAKLESDRLASELEEGLKMLADKLNRGDEKTRVTMQALAEVVRDQSTMTASEIGKTLEKLQVIANLSKQMFGATDAVTKAVEHVISETQRRSSFREQVTQATTTSLTEKLQSAGSGKTGTDPEMKRRATVAERAMIGIFSILAERKSVSLERANADLTKKVNWQEQNFETRGKKRSVGEFVDQQRQAAEKAAADKKAAKEAAKIEGKEAKRGKSGGEKTEEGEKPGLLGLGLRLGMIRAAYDAIRKVILIIKEIIAHFAAPAILLSGAMLIGALKDSKFGQAMIKLFDFIKDDAIPKISGWFETYVTPAIKIISDWLNEADFEKWAKQIDEFIFQPIAKIFSTIVGVFKPILDEMNWENIKAVAEDAWKNYLWPFIKSVVKLFQSLAEFLAPITKELAVMTWEGVKIVWGVLKEFTTNLTKLFETFAIDLSKGADWENLKNMLDAALGLISAPLDLLGRTVAKIGVWFAKQMGWEAMEQGLDQVAKDFSVWKMIRETAVGLYTWAKEIYEKSIAAMKDAYDYVANGEWLKQLQALVMDKFDFVTAWKDKLSAVIDEYSPVKIITQFFVDLGTWMKSIFAIDFKKIIKDSLPDWAANALFDKSPTKEVQGSTPGSFKLIPPGMSGVAAPAITAPVAPIQGAVATPLSSAIAGAITIGGNTPPSPPTIASIGGGIRPYAKLSDTITATNKAEAEAKAADAAKSGAAPSLLNNTMIMPQSSTNNMIMPKPVLNGDASLRRPHDQFIPQ